MISPGGNSPKKSSGALDRWQHIWYYSFPTTPRKPRLISPEIGTAHSAGFPFFWKAGLHRDAADLLPLLADRRLWPERRSLAVRAPSYLPPPLQFSSRRLTPPLNGSAWADLRRCSRSWAWPRLRCRPTEEQERPKVQIPSAVEEKVHGPGLVACRVRQFGQRNEK